MGPSSIVPKDKDKGKLLDGSGVALEATIPDPTIRTGTDQEIMHPLNHVFPLEMITQWILLPSSAKPQMTKNARNTERLVDASNVESKVTLSATALTKRHMLELPAQYKLKITINRSLLKLLPHLHLLLCK